MDNYPWPQLCLIFLISLLLKLLLVPGYFSTDFDVHQNWLRITHTLPLSQWYHDSASQWTLDYPPLFAYFEWFLAQIAALIDPHIVATINSHPRTVIFQRLSVILSEIPLLLALYHIIGRIDTKMVLAYFWVPLILLDNIHFQYNIIMQALLLVSVNQVQKGRYLRGAFAYSALLNFKHIYLYASLAFFAYLLKKYVLAPERNEDKIRNLFKLGVVTLLPFIISFGPFLLSGGIAELSQILSRLFPFQRGLIHEYWAPNFWALYYFIDKLANIAFARFFSTPKVSFHPVGNDLHQLKFLPQPSALLTTLIILALTLPILLTLIRKNIPFPRLVLVCGLLFFTFGFHVHQKAIAPYLHLMFVFMHEPISKTAPKYRSSQLLNSAIFVNIVNLLPLLTDDNQKILRVFLPIVWLAVWEYCSEIESIFDQGITSLGTSLVIFHELIHPFVDTPKLAFLPLMLNSVFAATFNLIWLALLYYETLTLPPQQQQHSLPQTTSQQGYSPVLTSEQH